MICFNCCKLTGTRTSYTEQNHRSYRTNGFTMIRFFFSYGNYDDYYYYYINIVLYFYFFYPQRLFKSFFKQGSVLESTRGNRKRLITQQHPPITNGNKTHDKCIPETRNKLGIDCQQ